MLPGSDEWCALAGRAWESAADLFLLSEMPFGAWVAAAERPSDEAWAASCRVHEEGIALLGQLGAPAVLGTRPALEGGRRVNQGFAWDAAAGPVPVHTKQFFPDEAGYHEARWFERGETHFRAAEVRGLRVGFLICTEVMFNEWARWYGRQGADLIVVPRVTPRSSLWRWKTAVGMAAIVSGCYVASSNRAGTDADGQEFGGAGWIVDPTGRLVAETSAERPVVAAELDVSLIERAQREYPCYVRELEGPVAAGPRAGSGAGLVL